MSDEEEWGDYGEELARLEAQQVQRALSQHTEPKLQIFSTQEVQLTCSCRSKSEVKNDLDRTVHEIAQMLGISDSLAYSCLISCKWDS